MMRKMGSKKQQIVLLHKLKGDKLIWHRHLHTETDRQTNKQMANKSLGIIQKKTTQQRQQQLN